MHKTNFPEDEAWYVILLYAMLFKWIEHSSNFDQ